MYEKYMRKESIEHRRFFADGWTYFCIYLRVLFTFVDLVLTCGQVKSVDHGKFRSEPDDASA